VTSFLTGAVRERRGPPFSESVLSDSNGLQRHFRVAGIWRLPRGEEGFPNPREGKSKPKEGRSKPSGRKIQARGKELQALSFRESSLFKELRRALGYSLFFDLLWRIKIISTM
jgi:hypothetical protein